MHSTIDYKEVGLRVGLEVHQQLLTDKKMFCHCPSGAYTKNHDGAVLRHMRPTLSELGEYDGTALMEFKTRKNIVYLLHGANVCTYEMDDTPPFLVNEEAVDIAIEQCLMLGCDIVDEVHIARKQYLDGSIPTGFQRTAIVGVNGRIPFRGRELTVTQVSVEEDSCREVFDRGHLIVWRADRLGMPLIETVTEPELTTPEEVEEAILLIGRVCRTTGHVRTGIGASRQDVNVSVRGGQRVEIKGVPQAWRARQLVHGEAVRQVELLQLRDELQRRNFKTPESIEVEHFAVTELFTDSLIASLREANWLQYLEEGRRPTLEKGQGPFCVRAVKLLGLAGTLTWPSQPEKTFAHELAGRIRVIATLDQAPILLHGDAWPEGAQSELERLRRYCGCSESDGIVVVWGAESDTLTAAEEIRLRYGEATQGVPQETRQALDDLSTDFERILPGPDRMYPDTDSPPQRILRQRVERLQRDLPPPPWEREEHYAAAKVPQNTTRFLIRRNGADLVDRMVEHHGVDLRRAAIFFGEELKGMAREGFAVDKIPAESWHDLFAHAKVQAVVWEGRRRIVEALAEDPGRSVAEIVAAEALGSEPVGWHEALEQLAIRVLESGSARGDGALRRHLMGLAMKTLRGRVPAVEVAASLDNTLACRPIMRSTAARPEKGRTR